MSRLVENETQVPTPPWVISDGRYIEGVDQMFREIVLKEFDKAGVEEPNDLEFGLLLNDSISVQGKRAGNRFYISPAYLGNPGTAGSRSFRKRWDLSRDRRSMVELVKKLMTDDGQGEDPTFYDHEDD